MTNIPKFSEIALETLPTILVLFLILELDDYHILEG
jgi:hypothetical protein